MPNQDKKKKKPITSVQHIDMHAMHHQASRQAAQAAPKATPKPSSSDSSPPQDNSSNLSGEELDKDLLNRAEEFKKNIAQCFSRSINLLFITNKKKSPQNYYSVTITRKEIKFIQVTRAQRSVYLYHYIRHELKHNDRFQGPQELDAFFNMMADVADDMADDKCEVLEQLKK